MHRVLKETVLRGVTLPPVTRLLRGLGRDRVTIFMLHRLQDPTRGVSGHSPRLLRAVLGRLNREGVRFPTLEECIAESMADPGPPGRAPAVVFTLDDGYHDQVSIAAPIFAEFRCPATVFLATGFVDRAMWLWWDQLEYLVQGSRRTSVDRDTGRVDLSSQVARAAFLDERREALKRFPLDGIRGELLRLSALLDVELPVTPPDRYAPSDWEEIRKAEGRGIHFAPHTVNHPILSREPDAGAEEEIAESWRRVSAELSRPCPVFAYPNGMPGDFSDREVRIVQEIGLKGAVTAREGVLLLRRAPGMRSPFRIPRMPFPEDLPRVLAPTLGLSGDPA